MIKVIQTKYKGILFRSRLEARWAVFLDKLNIKWFYEFEGYDLDGVWYLPDFWLPTFSGGMFMEVKPQNLVGVEMEKCMRLVEATKKQIWLAVGHPDYKAYNVLYYATHTGIGKVDFYKGTPNFAKAERENRMWTDPGYSNDEVPISLCSETYINAVESALSERFKQ